MIESVFRFALGDRVIVAAPWMPDLDEIEGEIISRTYGDHGGDVDRASYIVRVPALDGPSDGRWFDVDIKPA